MALIKCYECGAEISNKASCCPKCGAPVIVHSWRCSKCGNMISEEPCPYCNNIQLSKNTNEDYKNNIAVNPETVKNNQITVKNNNANRSQIIISIFIAILLISSFFPLKNYKNYYVAKMPSYSAGTIKVDGYMHKDKSCCQNIANAFGADVIRVKPKDKAGTNEYGQTISYEDAFNYCPLCCD